MFLSLVQKMTQRKGETYSVIIEFSPQYSKKHQRRLASPITPSPSLPDRP